MSISLKYCTPHPLWKLVQMWSKVDVSKNLCNEEWQIDFKNEGGMQVFLCKSIFLADYEQVSIHLKYYTPILLLKIVKMR